MCVRPQEGRIWCYFTSRKEPQEAEPAQRPPSYWKAAWPGGHGLGTSTLPLRAFGSVRPGERCQVKREGKRCLSGQNIMLRNLFLDCFLD